MSVENSHLEPSILDPSRFNLRNKGLRTVTGRLYKGCVKDAYTKLSIGSIPSNYESIIYHHEEKRGFGTSQKRFCRAENKSQINRTFETENIPQEKELQESVSFSKKGYGPFIAKESREWRKFPQSPGPGKYFDQKQQIKTASAKRKLYFSKEKQEFKRKEFLFNKQNIDTPGPGYYEPIQLESKHRLLGCRSAFVSKQKRETYIQKSLSPELGSQSSPSFTEKKDRKKREILQDELFMKLSKQRETSPKYFIPKRKQIDVPGPAFYDYEEPNFKPLYQRVKISNNFVQGNKNRFNDPIQEANQQSPNSPTPCSYTVPSSFDKIEKKLIDMAAFMSESKREPFSGKGLGPNLQNDGKTKENKNFHFNIRGQWL